MICEWRSGQRSTPAGGVVIAKEARHSRLSTLSGHRADCGDLPVSKPASAHGAPSPSHGLSKRKIATSAPTTSRAPTPPIAALPRDDRPIANEARRGRLSGAESCLPLEPPKRATDHPVTVPSPPSGALHCQGVSVPTTRFARRGLQSVTPCGGSQNGFNRAKLFHKSASGADWSRWGQKTFLWKVLWQRVVLPAVEVGTQNFPLESTVSPPAPTGPAAHSAFRPLTFPRRPA